ncbi:ribonucleotide-diphosphate reductase subunit beta [Mesorhizobium loti]|uniref:50S ribosomal protein L11 methyltransferase n=1 Tax=Mesorhizobium TaxID=68287 RepID=UPI000BAF655B|nr:MULTISPECIES: 50S ribosomal protein L11 methyltransferase [Mesorhizobium]PBB11762.1 ribonucleotide-diphosphate reductase subunit beta [Mesorhizobium loti]PBC07519.1 ribonucleotide-diphosphate reductase subunit beta [Mesorhizobium sp. WSM3859]
MTEINSRARDGSKIPRWHFTMLRDSGRNAAIEAAIASCNVIGKTVVEIGTGAGLPAMLFAKYGARKVFTCEMDKRLAEVAREVTRANDLQDRIAVIAKSSRQAILDGDLPSAPDFIFTETLDCGVVGEGYAVIAEDIRHLAGPRTVVMPERVQQFGFLCTDTLAFKKNSVSTQCGFDLSHLNLFAEHSYFAVNKILHDPECISATVLFRQYDYLDPNALESVEHRIIAHSSGLCHGMTSYFDAYFGKFLVTSRDPKSHWATAFHPLREPVPVESGQHYYLRGTETGLIELISV